MLLVFALLLPVCLAAPWNLNIVGNVTTSGISAGAFVAVQYAVAFSASVDGVGVFAGGPYYCGQNSMLTAMTSCMETGLLIDVPSLASYARSFASDQHIDSVEHLKYQRMYLFSGQADNTVSTMVVQDTEADLKLLGVPEANFQTSYALNAGHGIPTLDYGVGCSETASPYLMSCGYDGIGSAFQWIYGKKLADRTTTLPAESNWKSIYTYDYVPSGWTCADAALGDYTKVYVPTACQHGAACRLHIAWHGCAQGIDFIGDTFYKHAGYWQWAETNNIVVLFPQGRSNYVRGNPLGCFDWWGYTSHTYAFKEGVQLSTIQRIVDYLRK